MSAAQSAAGRVSAWSRRRKLELFLRELRPTPETTVVDVGVTDTGGDDPYGTHNFFEALYPWPAQVTAVSTQHLDRFAESFPHVQTVQADGRDLPFADREFDIAFSNAVLEHVGPGHDQRAFVHELCRVGGRVFLATPNRRFPVDSHTLVPFAHWLPLEPRERVYRRLGREQGLGVRLLGAGELLELFPLGSEPRLVRRGMNLVVVAGT